MVCAGFFVACGNDDGVSGLLPDTSRAKPWIWLGNHAGLYRQNSLTKKNELSISYRKLVCFFLQVFQFIAVDDNIDRKIQRLMQKYLTALHWTVDLLLFN